VTNLASTSTRAEPFRDLELGKELHTLRGHQGPVRTLALTAEGLIVSGELGLMGSDPALRVWDTSGNQVREFREHGAIVEAIAMTPEGIAVSASDDESVIAFQPGTGATFAAVSMEGRIESISLSTDGSHILTGDTSPAVSCFRMVGGPMPQSRTACS
jgi:WD40 repeat protein